LDEKVSKSAHWMKKYPNLHIGENAIDAYLKDARPGKKTIFIDEANISKRQWSEFEGLRKRPQGMLAGDEYITLEGKEDDYCAIFAGNPQSDGGERQLPSLLQRHACTIIFDPLPPAVLYRDKLLPILRELRIENEQEIERLATPFLNVMQFLTRCDPNKVLMSPRELGMMALLTVCYCKNNREANPYEVAKYYAYHLGKDLVPETHQAAFKEKFGDIPQLQKSAERERFDQQVGKRLSLNEANQPALAALNDALDLRTMRQNNEKGSILAASSALGGVLIEGEPGVGKSQLVQEALRARGFIARDEAAKSDESQHKYDPSKVFYMLPASMPPFQKESLLLEAFHAGAVVLLEEINSAPMMERLLNNLLMGQDTQGKAAEKSGFTVIGTQNPPTQAGRNRATAAQLRRFRNMSIRPYKRAELIGVLQKIRIEGLEGLSPEISADMVDAYLERQKIAIAKGEEPLCLRDLIKRAEQEIRELHLRAAEEPAQLAAPADHFTSLRPDVSSQISGTGGLHWLGRNTGTETLNSVAQYLDPLLSERALQTPPPPQSPAFLLDGFGFLARQQLPPATNPNHPGDSPEESNDSCVFIHTSLLV
jgi:MoxR-like ATPase